MRKVVVVVVLVLLFWAVITQKIDLPLWWKVIPR